MAFSVGSSDTASRSPTRMITGRGRGAAGPRRLRNSTSLQQDRRPGGANDQAFQLTAWRVAHDADEPWGSCFYFVRPRVRTKIEIQRAEWFEERLSLHGRLVLDTDQSLTLAGQLPLQVRVRLEVDSAAGGGPEWVTAAVQPSGIFTVVGPLAGSAGQVLRAQAWFDRTDLLGSSRSDSVECPHTVRPVIG